MLRETPIKVKVRRPIRRKSKTEIILETAHYYSTNTNRRSYISGVGCKYTDEFGRHCAVGRVLMPRHQRLDFRENGGIGALSFKGGVYTTNIDHFLRPQYHGHDIEFWVELQDLHDISSYWNENGLTQNGLYRLETLIKQYADE